MELAAFAAFAVLIVAWIALPLRAPKIEVVPEERAA